ncbi:hypothetical protein V6N13_017212 [Hibiscus sabdariffa]|uniref:DUF4283 domain-containing protein n=1 Tax=Hibiscus sabdariffa TaxID=183260 RepID=A0ABR2D1B9_9ROSI
MYDATFVQQSLLSEGFRVKVSVWSGYYVLVHFEEEEQLSICWDLKESMLKSWFDDIDSMESFSKNKKLKVWVIFENFPLVAWNENIFTAIVKRWGCFLKVDDETLRRIRFDQARILIGVSQISDIPSAVNIWVNNTSYHIRISTVPYEDQHCWIDGGSPSNNVDDFPIASVEEDEELGSYRLENLNTRFNTKAARRVPRNVGDKYLYGETDKIINEGTKVDMHRTKENYNMGPGQETLPDNIHNASDDLIDIPILSDSVSSLNSPETSEPNVPILDKDTGLFKIRPNYLRKSSLKSLNYFPSKLISSQLWASPKFEPSITDNGNHKDKVQSSDNISDIQNGEYRGLPLGKDFDEADAILETSSKLEIKFRGGREAISKKLSEVKESA